MYMLDAPHPAFQRVRDKISEFTSLDIGSDGQVMLQAGFLAAVIAKENDDREAEQGQQRRTRSKDQDKEKKK